MAYVDTVLILDGNRQKVAAEIGAARSDIRVIAVDEAMAPPDGDYAVIAFAPGAHGALLDGAKWIHCGGAGYDKIQATLSRPPQVATRTVGTLGRQLAEYVLAYYLRRAQKLDRRAALQVAHDWDNASAQGAYAFTERAILFGTGPMGATIAQYLHYLGLETIGVARSERPVEGFDRVITLGGLADVEPGTLDLAVLALPDNDVTRGLIDETVLAHFRDVQLINVGRGSALPEAALFRALDAGHVGEAVLDVTAVEPLPPTSPLWDHERIIVTPHVSGGTRPEDIIARFLANLDDLEAGRTPQDKIELA